MKNQDKKVRLKKIPLGVFIQSLMDIYNMGVNYVDLIGVPGEQQDTIGIAFSDEYLNKEEEEENDNNETETTENFEDLKENIKDIKLSDDDLNQLL